MKCSLSIVVCYCSSVSSRSGCREEDVTVGGRGLVASRGIVRGDLTIPCLRGRSGSSSRTWLLQGENDAFSPSFGVFLLFGRPRRLPCASSSFVCASRGVVARAVSAAYLMHHDARRSCPTSSQAKPTPALTDSGSLVLSVVDSAGSVSCSGGRRGARWLGESVGSCVV